MATQRRNCDQQLRLDALQFWQSSDKWAAQTEHEHGIGKGLLSKWRRSLADKENEAFRGNARSTPAQERIRALERELHRVTQE